MEEKIIGPKTSRKEFFSEHLKLDLPEFKGIKEALEKDDIALCEKLFADAMRKSPMIEHFVSERKSSLANISDKYREEVYTNAKEAMEYTVTSCGIKHTFEDGKIIWTHNPTYNNYAEWVYQLSRHPMLGYLTQYYYLTWDEKAAKVYTEYLQSWLEQAIVPENALPWHTWLWRTIEAGIRMMGWCNHFYSMINTPYVTDRLICDFFTSIYEHGWRLRKDCFEGNWLIMEMHGLIKLSLSCPFIKESDAWFDFGINKLMEELDHQIHPDGWQQELSTNYHFVVDHNYVNVLRTIKSFGLEPPKEMLSRMEILFEMYHRLCRPCKKLPDLNDGSQLDVAWRYRQILDLYPHREDFKWFATDGKEGKKPSYTSYSFPYAGAIIMRSGWEKNDLWAYMDPGPIGYGHQHEDCLNVLLDAYGKVMLTEAGTYAYDSSEMRKYGLSTRGHNTVLLNGKEQKELIGFDRFKVDLKTPADRIFVTNDDYDMGEGLFNKGYGEDKENMTHRRKLIFVKNGEKYGLKPFFIVIDRFTAPDENARKYEQMWHTEAISYENGICDFGDGVGLVIAASDKDATFVNMRGQHEPYYQGFMPIFPPGDHEHRPIHTPVLVGEFEGKKRVVTVLYPFNENENNLVCIEASTDFDATDITLVTKNGKFTLDESRYAPTGQTATP